LGVEEVSSRRHFSGVSKPTKNRRPRRRRSAWLAVIIFLVVVAVGIAWWQRSNTKTDAPKNIAASVPSTLTNVPTSTGGAVSNAFDMGKFAAWVTNQSDVDGLLDSGGRLLQEGRADLGFLCFHRVVELKPEHEEAWFNLGVALVRLGELAEAEYAYRRAITNFNEYSEARNNLGNLFTRQKRYVEAAEQFNTVLEQTPDNASAHNNLGRVLAEQGNAMAALERFTEAARLDTNYLEARFNLGAAHLSMGQTNEAVASFREVLRLRPDFRPALNALAKLRKTP
jgi:tetratricopeptide (TPR) repeat protein